MSVHELIEVVEKSTQRLKNHAAAYGAMMRVIEAAPEDRAKVMPVFVWPARLTDAPIEIQTDLSALDPEAILALARSVGSVHYQALYEATQSLAESSQELLQCFSQQQQQSVEQPSAPATPAAPAAPVGAEPGIPPIVPAADGPVRLVPPSNVQPGPGAPPSP